MSSSCLILKHEDTQMPNVTFTLKDVNNNPIASTAFKIAAGFPDERYDPTLPIPAEQTVTTNGSGQVTVSLQASTAPYYISRATGTSDEHVAYKFFVPDTTAALTAEFLYVDLGLHQRLLNDKSLLTLIDAKVSVLNSNAATGLIVAAAIANTTENMQATEALVASVEAYAPGNPMDHGAIGDGVADDSIAVAAAITAGGWVVINRPHLVQGSMSIPSNTTIEFRPGGKFIDSDGTFSLSPTGTLATRHLVGTEPSRGDLTLDAGVGNGVLYAGGDVIWLQSEEQALEYNVLQADRTYKIHKKAEMAIVDSVDGDTLTLQGPILDDYTSHITSISAANVGNTGGFTGLSATTVSITTAVPHGLTVGMPVTISGVTGMTEINGAGWLVYYASSTVFRIKSALGVPLDGTGFGAYISGGTVSFHALTKMAKVTTVDNVTIINPQIHSNMYNAPGYPTTVPFIYGTFCRNLQIQGGWLREGNGMAVLLNSCLDSGKSNVTVSELHDIQFNPTSYGYGVEISGASQNITIEGCRYRRCRHAVTTGTAGSGVTPNYGVQRGIAINGCTAINCTSVSFDTHEDTDSIVFSGCTVIGGQLAGYQARAYDVTFNGCNVYGMLGNGIYLDNASAKVCINGGTVSRCRDTGLITVPEHTVAAHWDSDGVTWVPAAVVAEATVETNRGHGIRSDTGKVTISAVQISECDNFGLNLTGKGGADANISGLTVLNCGRAPSSTYAHTAGIYIDAPLNRLTMVGVSSHDTRTTKLQAYGVWFDTDSVGEYSPVLVSGCNFENNLTGALLDTIDAGVTPKNMTFTGNAPVTMWGGTKFLSITTGSIAATTQTEVTVALGFTAPSTNYRVNHAVVGTDLELRNITSKSTTSYKVMVYNRGAGPQTGTIESTISVRK